MLQPCNEDHIHFYYRRGSEEINIKYDVNSSICNDLDVFVRFLKAVGYTDKTIKDGIVELAREIEEEEKIAEIPD